MFRKRKISLLRMLAKILALELPPADVAAVEAAWEMDGLGS